MVEREIRRHGLKTWDLSRLIVLFDGLNEIPAHSRTNRIRMLNRWCDQNSTVIAIFTSRRRDYRKGEKLDLPEVEILPLNRERIVELTFNYFNSLNLDGADVLLENLGWLDGKTTPLLQIAELCRNPLHLIQLCFVYCSNEGIPQNVAELFRKFVRICLERNENLSNAEYRQLESSFGHIAYDMYSMKKSDAGSEQRYCVLVDTKWAAKRLVDRQNVEDYWNCLLYTSPSPRDRG